MPREADRCIHTYEHAHQAPAILNLLRTSGTLTVEEIVARIPAFNWSQLFLTVDLLSRTGEIVLRREGFTYILERCKPSSVPAGE